MQMPMFFWIINRRENLDDTMPFPRLCKGSVLNLWGGGDMRILQFERIFYG